MLAALRRVWSWRSFAGVVCATSCAIAVAACFLRGPSLDEFATELYADPAIPLAKAWFELWPTETNPPFFYLIARWGVETLGDPLYARRLVDAAPLLGLAAWFVAAARRRPERRGFLAAYAILTVCGKIFLTTFPFYRSYFWQYAAEVVFCGAAALAWLEGRRSVEFAQLAALPFLILLHQVTALYAVVFASVFAVANFAARRPAPAIATLSVGAVSAVPLLAFSALQLGHHAQVMGEVDWIPRLGVLASLAEIGAIFPGAMAQNWAAAGCAVLALAAASRPRGRRAVTIALLLGSAIAATALVLAINAVKPIVVQRYFSFVFVECACALAVLIAPWLDSHRRVAWLAPLNAAAFLLTYGVTQAHKPLWERGAEQVAAIVRACPTARVRGGSRPEDPRETLGLTYLGRRHGFKVLPVAPDAPDDCPVLYWTEQNAPTDSEVAVFAGNLARAANAKAGYQLPEALLSAATAERTNNGAIIIVGARAK